MDRTRQGSLEPDARAFYALDTNRDPENGRVSSIGDERNGSSARSPGCAWSALTDASSLNAPRADTHLLWLARGRNCRKITSSQVQGASYG